MPANIVKTKSDEKAWNKAKSIAEKSDPDNLYALTTHIFKNIKKHKKKRKKKAFFELLREAAVNLTKEDKKNLLEDLSDLEHDQWSGWAKSKLDEVSDDTADRWKKLFVPYEKLPEEEKEKDRPFAKKVMKVMEEYDLLS